MTAEFLNKSDAVHLENCGLALDNRLGRKAGDMRKAKGDVDVSMVERILRHLIH